MTSDVSEEPVAAEPLDDELKQFCLDTVKKVDDAINIFHMSDAVEAVINLAKRCNKYIDETAPWALAKNEANKARLGTVLYNLLESIRYIAVLIEPFMPDTNKAILKQINCDCADYESLKMAKMIEISDGELDSAKKRLSKLIRDVNKCITLLSE